MENNVSLFLTFQSDELSLQKKLRTEVIQLEDTLAQVRKEYEMLRIEFEQNLAANEQAGTFSKHSHTSVRDIVLRVYSSVENEIVFVIFFNVLQSSVEERNVPYFVGGTRVDIKEDISQQTNPLSALQRILHIIRIKLSVLCTM